MKKARWFVFFGVLALFSIPGGGMAETMYVTDRLYLSLRNVPDPEQPSIGVVQSDTKVEVIETEEEWAKVSLEDGRMGWVMKKYLANDPPKAMLIEELQNHVKDKARTIEHLRGQVASISLTVKQLEEEVKKKSLKIRELERKTMDTSPAPQEPAGEIKEMALLLQRLREENASLKEETSGLEALKSREAAMRNEIEELKRKTQEQDRSIDADRISLARRKEIYVIGIAALAIGFFVGYLVRRPDKNRFYLK